MRHSITVSAISLCIAMLGAGLALAAPAPATADARFAEGAFGQARPLYQAAVGNNPNDVHALNRLGEIALYANRLPEAKRHFEAALHVNPADKFAQAELAEIQARSGANGSYRIEGGGRASIIPFVAADPLPIIRVRINGRRDADFLIDTGAPGVVLDPAVARELHLDIESAGRGTFAGGKHAGVSKSTIDSITLGTVTIHSLPVMVMPMGGAPAPAGMHVDGIVGTSLLYHFLSTLDYAHGRLILAPRSDSARFVRAAKQHGDSIVPLWYVPDHFLFARAQVKGAAPALFNIDTGAPGLGVQVSRDLMQKSHIALDNSHKSRMRGPGGDVTTINFTTSVTVGTTHEDEVPGMLTPGGDQYGIFPFAVGGTVSDAFFRKRAVSFDFKAMLMVIAKR
ncbi:MAG: aspartyl protease family protein [Pseudomonadota bacterium]|nr:aspartyl protease family protein [Pseudomonadota bacterium]